jgi:hypothetical protein
MRRTPVAVLASLAVLLAAPAAHAQDAPPPLRASMAACGTGPTPAERFAVVTASMPAARGTRRMAMRFDLFERRGRRGPWTAVRARGFGRWERSDPNRAGFLYTKRVERLSQNRVYRAVVRFRWYTASGRVQRSALRRTRWCRQPDQRPNLRIAAVDVRPGATSDRARYVVTVENAGRTAAGAFDVGLVVRDEASARPVAGLPAGERATVELPGPACEGAERLQVTADVEGTVRESDERDNRYIRLCGGR